MADRTSSECSGFGVPLVGGLPRPCPYPATDAAVIGNVTFPSCYFHGKVLEGLITDAGGKPLSWPTKPRKELERQPEDTLTTLLREWA